MSEGALVVLDIDPETAEVRRTVRRGIPPEIYTEAQAEGVISIAAAIVERIDARPRAVA